MNPLIKRITVKTAVSRRNISSMSALIVAPAADPQPLGILPSAVTHKLTTVTLKIYNSSMTSNWWKMGCILIKLRILWIASRILLNYSRDACKTNNLQIANIKCKAFLTKQIRHTISRCQFINSSTTTIITQCTLRQYFPPYPQHPIPISLIALDIESEKK